MNSNGPSKLTELEQWREMFFATMIPDDFKPEGSQTLWPNPWKKEVAMCAFLINNLQNMVKPKSTEDLELFSKQIEQICSLIYQNGIDHNEQAGLANIEAIKQLFIENAGFKG